MRLPIITHRHIRERARERITSQLNILTGNNTNDADDIAAFLTGMGLTGMGVAGKPNNPDSCPIAKFIRTLGFAQVLVSAINAEIHVTGKPILVPLPAAIRGFIQNFDHGDYPRLISS